MTPANTAARIFKVLSVETRVPMIELLKSRSLGVNVLAQALSISPAAPYCLAPFLMDRPYWPQFVSACFC